MSVEIEPNELSFQRPFTVEVSKTLTIKNPNSTPIVFKVKTTAPKQYCVRPNAGRIEPGQEGSVTVLLQAMKVDPPPETKCRDKFLVQSVAIGPDQEFASINTILDAATKSQIQEKKIRVTWASPPAGNFDGVAVASAPSAVTETPRKSTSASLNGHNTETPEANHFSSPSAEAPASAPPPYDKEEEAEVKPTDHIADAKSAVSAAASTVANTAQVTYEELKNQLAAAERQIATLKDQGLRQRNVKSGGEKESGAAPIPQLAQAAKQTVEGVSVPLVAGLCLFSFLLAYFFF